jgi:hypothetical protein
MRDSHELRHAASGRRLPRQNIPPRWSRIPAAAQPRPIDGGISACSLPHHVDIGALPAVVGKNDLHEVARLMRDRAAIAIPLVPVCAEHCQTIRKARRDCAGEEGGKRLPTGGAAADATPEEQLSRDQSGGPAAGRLAAATRSRPMAVAMRSRNEQVSKYLPYCGKA